jgi:hypothetical protein
MLDNNGAIYIYIYIYIYINYIKNILEREKHRMTAKCLCVPIAGLRKQYVDGLDMQIVAAAMTLWKARLEVLRLEFRHWFSL